MNGLDVIGARLNNQKLVSPGFKMAAEVVRWFGAVQAQDFKAAKWALALRMRTATDAVVEDAFNKGEILRTHVMRPTWHFVAPEDIRWLLQLTAPRVNLKCGPNNRKFELDAALFKRSNKIFEKALRGGNYLIRSELKSALNRAQIDANDPVRLVHILLRAELDGVICSGPRLGKQFTYALLEERTPVAKILKREEALAELTRRYFTSHGPATLPDFVWWSGLTVDDAKRGIASIDSELEKAKLHEKVYWSARTSRTRQQSANSIHLLPAFDEYFVAYKDRQIAVAPSLSTWDVLGPTFLIDGIATGTWKRSESGNIEFNTSRALKKSEKLALDEAADRYAAYLGDISRRR
ncbi:MAG TPA: winged helix DNA-binding domain-containing protein [Pyrinomonadaceae bacterium]|nr:winged helix DNA-binding domain-containing protein [Pyrinomonadaceae bacterium]